MRRNGRSENWGYGHIDIPVTTNGVGSSQADGLFGVVLKCCIAVDEVVYFGNNEVGDIQAAQKEGILALLYNEKRTNRIDP